MFWWKLSIEQQYRLGQSFFCVRVWILFCVVLFCFLSGNCQHLVQKRKNRLQISFVWVKLRHVVLTLCKQNFKASSDAVYFSVFSKMNFAGCTYLWKNVFEVNEFCYFDAVIQTLSSLVRVSRTKSSSTPKAPTFDCFGGMFSARFTCLSFWAIKPCFHNDLT